MCQRLNKTPPRSRAPISAASRSFSATRTANIPTPTRSSCAAPIRRPPSIRRSSPTTSAAEFDATDLVILGHVHEDHMAGLHRLPKAPVHVHEADLPAAQSWDGLVAAYGSDESYVDAMLEKFRQDFFYAPRPDAIGYADGAVWDLGKSRVRAFHMPGHTAGHCVLLVEPEGVAFIGDIDLSGFGPYYGDASSSLGDFRSTLARRGRHSGKGLGDIAPPRRLHRPRKIPAAISPPTPECSMRAISGCSNCCAPRQRRWRNWSNAGCCIRPAIRISGWSMRRPARSRCISPRCWPTGVC